MLVTSHAYAIDIVTAAEDAHQDAHNQVAVVMINQRESTVVSPFCMDKHCRLSYLATITTGDDRSIY